MKRTLMQPDLSSFPEQFRPLLASAKVYDSSCSPVAKVWFLDTEGGLYLKSAPLGKLESEVKMTAYFHSKGLGAEVIAYHRDTRDWLLTRAIPGEDCTFPAYLEDPKRLSETLGIQLRQLHSLDFSDCPIIRNDSYKAYARYMYENRLFDPSEYPDCWGYDTPEEAWHIFSGFIDIDRGGIGDRHIDLFWGIWTLNYNLKTNAYGDRFLDAYGREDVEEEMFPIIRAFECFG